MNTAPTVFNVTDAVCVSNDINSTKMLYYSMEQ